jgi:transcription factor E2F3
LKDLIEEDKKLDCMIDEIKTSFENLNEDKNFKEFGYVTFDEIQSLTHNQNVNLIAIKAPSGTSVEIPDPEHIEKIYLQTHEVKI